MLYKTGCKPEAVFIEYFIWWFISEKLDESIQHYLEIKVRQLSELGGSHYRIRNPQFRCTTADIAEQVVLLVDHAKSMYDETLHTVPVTNASNEWYAYTISIRATSAFDVLATNTPNLPQA